MPVPNVISKVLLADQATNRFADQLLAVLNPILRNVNGDLRGPVASPTVVGFFGLPLGEAMGSPAVDDVPKWNGSAWVPGVAGTAGAITAVTATGPLASSGGTTPNISLTGVVPIANGGTNGTSVPTLGGVAYGTGTALAWSAFSPVAGIPLLSGGLGAPIFGAIDFAIAGTITGILPIVNGGTGGSAVPTAGAVAYGNATSYAFTSVGSAGQFLTSAGSGTPTWTTPSASSSGAGVGGYRSTTTTPDTIALTDYVVDVNTTGAFTVNLPTAGAGAGQAASGRVFIVKNTGGATVTVAPAGAQLIDGAASFTIVTQYASFTFISTGSGWALL